MNNEKWFEHLVIYEQPLDMIMETELIWNVPSVVNAELI